MIQDEVVDKLRRWTKQIAADNRTIVVLEACDDPTKTDEAIKRAWDNRAIKDAKEQEEMDLRLFRAVLDETLKNVEEGTARKFRRNFLEKVVADRFCVAGEFLVQILK